MHMKALLMQSGEEIDHCIDRRNGKKESESKNVVRKSWIGTRKEIWNQSCSSPTHQTQHYRSYTPKKLGGRNFQSRLSKELVSPWSANCRSQTRLSARTVAEITAFHAHQGEKDPVDQLESTTVSIVVNVGKKTVKKVYHGQLAGTGFIRGEEHWN